MNTFASITPITPVASTETVETPIETTPIVSPIDISLAFAFVEPSVVEMLSKVVTNCGIGSHKEDIVYGAIISSLVGHYNKYDSLPTEAEMNTFITDVAGQHPAVSHSEIVDRIETANKNVGFTVTKEKFTEYYQDLLIELVKHDFNKDFFNDYAAASLDDKPDQIQKIVDKFTKNTENISFEKPVGTNLFDCSRRLKRRLNPDATISSGYPTIDRWCNGGLPADGDFLLTGLGQTGMGKSFFLCNMATNLVQSGKNVAYFSVEMSEDDILDRFDSLFTETSSFNIDEQLRRGVSIPGNYYQNTAGLGTLNVIRYTVLNSNSIKTHIERMIADGNKPDVVLVDYISLMEPNNPAIYNHQHEAVGKISEELRGVSKDVALPIVTVQQVNGEEKDSTKIGLTNISESKKIGFTSNVIIVLCEQEGDRQSDIVRLKLIKARSAAGTGTIVPFEMGYTTDTMRMKENVGINTNAQNALMGVAVGGNDQAKINKEENQRITAELTEKNKTPITHSREFKAKIDNMFTDIFAANKENKND